MFGTLHILCGRPHVLCCPRDLYSNLSYSIHVLCGFRQVAWYLWAFFFFLWNEHNSYLTGLLWENNWKLSSDTNMGLTDSFLSLLGYSDCVSLKWHFWRMTIKVKLAEKDEIMVEVQGFNGADLERKEQRRYCSCHWVLHAFLVFVVASQRVYFNPWYTGSENHQLFPGKQKMLIPADSRVIEPPCSALQGLTRDRLCITPNWGKGSD